MVLNKTNGNSIAVLAGSEETDDWPDTVIEIFPTTVEFQGKTVDCLRVRRPGTGPQPIPREHEADAPTDEDSIPF